MLFLASWNFPGWLRWVVETSAFIENPLVELDLDLNLKFANIITDIDLGICTCKFMSYIFKESQKSQAER